MCYYGYMKKSYFGFIILLIVFTLGGASIVFLPIQGEDILMRLLFNYCDLGMVILMLIIYKTGKVHWFTGITYEDALKVDLSQRKLYALYHLRDFSIFFVAYLVLSILFTILHITYYVDLIAWTITVVAVALQTIRYKL